MNLFNFMLYLHSACTENGERGIKHLAVHRHCFLPHQASFSKFLPSSLNQISCSDCLCKPLIFTLVLEYQLYEDGNYDLYKKGLNFRKDLDYTLDEKKSGMIKSPIFIKFSILLTLCSNKKSFLASYFEQFIIIYFVQFYSFRLCIIMSV